ncbi:MAG TPA: hypothetical protein VFN67_16495 [Polyangiales bacterium]|nr:hypothetical protein [Polyangiales bacterium]
MPDDRLRSHRVDSRATQQVGRCASEPVDGHVMTVVHTARKQGKTVLDFLVRAVTAHIDGTTAPQLLGEHAAA